jgi:hypothetical protein
MTSSPTWRVCTWAAPQQRRAGSCLARALLEASWSPEVRSLEPLDLLWPLTHLPSSSFSGVSAAKNETFWHVTSAVIVINFRDPNCLSLWIGRWSESLISMSAYFVNIFNQVSISHAFAVDPLMSLKTCKCPFCSHIHSIILQSSLYD